MTVWPALDYEERVDEDRDEAVMFRERRSPPRTYRAAVTPAIADITSIDLPGRIAADAAEAAAEIARFDAEMSGEFANFGAILLRSESSSSSEIENLTAGAKAISLAAIGDTRVGKNATLVVSNTLAMTRAVEMANTINDDSIIAMHAALLGDTRPQWVGHWRADQVRIGGNSVHDASFVPPHQSRVPAAMTDLVQFMNRTDLPLFEQAAVAHAQFETIHPFPDGNGRVGRALIHALYKHAGLTRNVTIPVSAGLLRDPELYFASLDEYRKGNVAAIVELMTSATYFAIENGKLLSRELADVKAQWRDGFKTRAGSTVEQLVDFLIRQPAIDTPLVQQEFSLSQQSAQVAINRLVEGGILKPASESKRNRRWVATEIIEALDRFAERSRRKKLR